MHPPGEWSDLRRQIRQPGEGGGRLLHGGPPRDSHAIGLSGVKQNRTPQRRIPKPTANHPRLRIVSQLLHHHTRFTSTNQRRNGMN